MKQFFKFAFASCLGVFLAGLAMTLVFGVGLGSMVKNMNKTAPVKTNSILKLNLAQPIPEKTNNLPNQSLDLENTSIVGVHDMVEAIENAKTDSKIKGILLDLSFVQAGTVTRTELRDALIDFKDSDKFVFAYSKNYAQNAYHLATAADKIFLNPLGSVEFGGYAANISFYKKMMEKLGVEMQVYYAGNFKGASEPYRLEKLSEPNRLQIREYINDLYSNLLTDVSEARGKTKAELRQIADEYLARSPEEAVTHGLVDEVAYFDQVISAMKARLGLEEDDKINIATMQTYHKGVKSKIDLKVKDRVAVVFAEGTINTGVSDPGGIGDDKYTKIIRKLRKDDKVKAIVMRVNSGGGSALASENIWRELVLAKEQGKVVVASMGDVAASGGYYISAMADKIIAEESTITGSIGVFSMIPNAKEMFDEKLGITLDTVLTGDMANGIYGVLVEPHTPKQKKILQQQTEQMYEIFLSRVAEGRGMTRDEVHEVAQGRVWTGTRALENGLIDELGDLEKSIEVAAELAGLEKYRVKEYPFIKEPIDQLMDKLTGMDKKEDKVEVMIQNSALKEYYPIYKTLKEIENMKGVQARMPFDLEIH